MIIEFLDLSGRLLGGEDHHGKTKAGERQINRDELVVFLVAILPASRMHESRANPRLGARLEIRRGRGAPVEGAAPLVLEVQGVERNEPRLVRRAVVVDHLRNAAVRLPADPVVDRRQSVVLAKVRGPGLDPGLAQFGEGCGGCRIARAEDDAGRARELAVPRKLRTGGPQRVEFAPGRFAVRNLQHAADRLLKGVIGAKIDGRQHRREAVVIIALVLAGVRGVKISISRPHLLAQPQHGWATCKCLSRKAVPYSLWIKWT